MGVCAEGDFSTAQHRVRVRLLDGNYWEAEVDGERVARQAVVEPKARFEFTAGDDRVALKYDLKSTVPRMRVYLNDRPYQRRLDETACRTVHAGTHFLNALRDGAQAALFMPRRPSWIRATTVLALYALFIVEQLLLSWLYFERPASIEFNRWSMAALFGYHAFVLIWIYLIRVAPTSSIAVYASLQQGLASALFISPLAAAATALQPDYETHFAIAGWVWWALAQLRPQMNNRIRLGGAIAFIPIPLLVSVLSPLHLFYPFYSATDDEADEATEADVNEEDIYYLQPQLMTAMTTPIAAGQPGVPELYFLAFAGDGTQGVFASETRYAQQLFNRRFNTHGRSLLLVNDIRDPQSKPLANLHNLRQALSAIGQQMNPGEDVLFIYLSSHGDRDAELYVDLPPLYLNNVSASDLDSALRDAGIRDAVIVVSACYAGSFIPALEDEHRLIIAAAAADRNSFGCGTLERFTYFGEAFLKDALARTYSFTEAFRQASQAVHKREISEKRTPSLPVIREGTAILPLLKQIELEVRRSAHAPLEVGSSSSPSG